MARLPLFMKLADALNSIPVIAVTGSTDVEIADVVFDSREVKPGSIFCALKGEGSDGHHYLDQALEAGALAVLSERAYPGVSGVTWVQVAKSRSAMAQLAANLSGHPSHEFPVIGVTGTNGKTTITFLIHHLLQSIVRRAGLIGTIHYATGEAIVPAPHTTPEAPEVHRLLREMRHADCRGVAMEVSSHGLSQSRVGGVSFAVGIFTNLTQDHLDYHRTMEEYFAAKRILFEQMDRDQSQVGTALINADDTYGDRLAKEKFTRIKVLTYGRSAGADLRIGEIRSDFHGTQFSLHYQGRQFLVKIPLIGSFNVSNAVAAIGAAHAIGLNLREVIAKMAESPQVPGRLELVGGRQTNFRVFVDYAHTPDALASVLRTLRDLSPRRLIVVFGCGGDRDRSKRVLMAEAAEQGGDFAILTSDNPRTEDPASILEQTARGFRGKAHEIIEDRRAAIQKAVDLAGERDIVLIAGKGHETYQEIDGVKHDFDDRRVAFGAISRKMEGGKA